MHAPQPIAAATGGAGEDCVLRYLQARELVVISRNYRCRGGEIDLVMHDAVGALVFVELYARVTRSTQHSGEAAASITSVKQRRLIAAAKDSFARQVEDIPAYRFDVIATDDTHIEWICDAFGVDT